MKLKTPGIIKQKVKLKYKDLRAEGFKSIWGRQVDKMLDSTLDKLERTERDSYTKLYQDDKTLSKAERKLATSLERYGGKMVTPVNDMTYKEFMDELDKEPETRQERKQRRKQERAERRAKAAYEHNTGKKEEDHK